MLGHSSLKVILEKGVLSLRTLRCVLVCVCMLCVYVWGGGGASLWMREKGQCPFIVYILGFKEFEKWPVVLSVCCRLSSLVFFNSFHAMDLLLHS